MIKVKARILTDVEYTLDTSDHDMAKRKLLDRLAIDGYANSEVAEITTTTLPDSIEDEFADINEYLPGPVRTPYGYMYGKI